MGMAWADRMERCGRNPDAGARPLFTACTGASDTPPQGVDLLAHCDTLAGLDSNFYRKAPRGCVTHHMALAVPEIRAPQNARSPTSDWTSEVSPHGGGVVRWVDVEHGLSSGSMRLSSHILKSRCAGPTRVFSLSYEFREFQFLECSRGFGCSIPHKQTPAAVACRSCVLYGVARHDHP